MDQYNNFNKLISILVPVYGTEKFIERCANSLFCQTVTDNIEYIFVDDCSKDNSIEILKGIVSRYPLLHDSISIIRHDTNRGLAAARQTALDHAVGEFVLTVDSDDWIELNTCETLLNLISNKNSADIYCFDYYAEYKNRQISIRDGAPKDGRDALNLLLIGKLHGGTCLKLIRRSLFTDNDIRYYEGLNMFEDISVSFRLLYFSRKIEKIETPLYHYFQDNESSYTYSLSQKSQSNILQLLDIMDAFFRNNKNDLEMIESYNIFKIRVYIFLMCSVFDFKSFVNFQKKLKTISHKKSPTIWKEFLLYTISNHLPPILTFPTFKLYRVMKNLKKQIFNL